MSRTTEVEETPSTIDTGAPLPPRRERTRSWFREHPLALVVIVAILLVGVVAGLWAWRYYSVRESTDDARIDGHIAPVSARVAGTVLEILVEENDIVKAGQVVARLDDRDYRIALQRAEADLTAQNAAAAAARTQIPIASTSTSSGLSAARGAQLEAQAGVAAATEGVRNAQARVAAAEANLRVAAANANRALKDLERYKILIARDEISRQQYDTAAAAAASAQAQVEAAQAAIAQARAGVDVAESQRRQAEARVAQAQSNVAAAGSGPQQVAVTRAQANAQQAVAGVRQSAVDQARLNVEYTIVKAPVAGIVGRRNVQIGQNVQPGQPLFSVVEVTNLWVTALFKETQLAHVQPGQKAVIEVDAFGGAELHGRVDSIGAATGGTFSVLPAENASGNYVKVVQRVPVKIVFEPNQPYLERLRPGMSVVPTVLLQ
ncbi:MAG: HlyD family secretion protein [Bryobacterales bacterium]|nr:HlyD family secretion protein [Bryobacterales bacterium]